MHWLKISLNDKQDGFKITKTEIATDKIHSSRKILAFEMDSAITNDVEEPSHDGGRNEEW